VTPTRSSVTAVEAEARPVRRADELIVSARGRANGRGGEGVARVCEAKALIVTRAPARVWVDAGTDVVHPGFPRDSVPWIPSSLVVWSCAASARSKSWAPVSERGSPREPCIRVPLPRERRHGHGLSVRDIPSGPCPGPKTSSAVSKAFRLSGVRCRRSPGCPTEGTAPISARRVASRTVGPPSRHRSGPDRGRTRDRHGTHPGGAGPPRRERGPSGPSSPRRPFSRRSCTSWCRGERRRPSLRWCGRGPVRDSAGVRTCSPKDPVNEVRGDVGTTASVVTPRRRSSPQIPDTARSRATWSRPTSERLAMRR